MEDLNLADLAQLDYLNRVIREGLRVFPPAADIFPRIIPEGGEVIMGKYLPEGVSPTHHPPSPLSLLKFLDINTS